MSEEEEKKKEEDRKIKLRQEKFCKFYVSDDRDFFGNGVESYMEAYDIGKDRYNTAKVNASQLLTKPNIIKRINELLETGGFNEENVDKQHLFLINQYADLKTKMQAIKEYNAVKNRVTKHIDVTSKGEVVKGFNYVKPEEKKKDE